LEGALSFNTRGIVFSLAKFFHRGWAAGRKASRSFFTVRVAEEANNPENKRDELAPARVKNLRNA